VNDLLFGPWPLFAIAKQYYSWQMLAAVLVAAQFGIVALYMMFGKKRSSRGGDGGDIGGWDFGDGDGGGCGD
jgi:hypothetical protein